MVTAELNRTPDLIPVPPEWMARQNQASGPSTNSNINDVYWRKPDGYIITGPSAELGQNGRPITAQAEGLIRRGWTPLVEYSYTNRVNSKTGHRETIEQVADKLNSPDRYYWLFANGGAHLFTIEQIVEHHWHITPPYGMKKEVFPQLLEWDVPDPYWCPVCAGSKPPKNSEEEVITHLMVDHRQTITQARDLQTATNNFMDKPRGSTGIAIRRKVQQSEAAIVRQEASPSPDLPVARLNICNDCGESIEGTDNFARARHMRFKHPKSSSEEASPEEGREE